MFVRYLANLYVLYAIIYSSLRLSLVSDSQVINKLLTNLVSRRVVKCIGVSIRKMSVLWCNNSHKVKPLCEFQPLS